MTAVPTASDEQRTEAPRWLTAEQLESWRAVSLMISRLPAALEQQLQCDSRLSYVEYYVLASLSDAPEHTVRLSTLATLANSELSRLSHLITRLEKRGFVRREPDPCNGRYTNAVLTDAGLAHLQAAAPAHVARVRDLMIDTLSAAELRQLGEYATRIVARLDADCTPDEPCAGACPDAPPATTSTASPVAADGN